MNIINGKEMVDGAFLLNPNIQYEVSTLTDNYTVNKYEDIGKVMVMNAGAVNKTITFPVFAASDVGKLFMFANTGTGRLTIQMGTGDSVADSTAAGTIYSDTDSVATLLLIVVNSNTLLIFGSTGTWTTT